MKDWKIWNTLKRRTNCVADEVPNSMAWHFTIAVPAVLDATRTTPRCFESDFSDVCIEFSPLLFPSTALL
jgi:hypothetical protein